MQGVVLDIDLKLDSGVISSKEGKRYVFSMQECLNDKPLPGSEVDFEAKDSTATAIYTTKKGIKNMLDWLFWFLFSFRGRISRDQFVVFLAVSAVCAPFLFFFGVIASGFQTFLGLAYLIAFYVKACVIVKRFHDVEACGWWYATFLIFTLILVFHATGVLILPFLTGVVAYLVGALYLVLSFFCLYLCFAKGILGKNKYGEVPYSCKTCRLK